MAAAKGQTQVVKLARILLAAVFLTSCSTVRLPSLDIKTVPNEHPLTWEKAASEAIGKNPDLLAARSAVQSAAYSRNIAAGDYLPSVDGVLSKNRTDSTTASPRDNLDIGIEATQTLFSGFETTGNTLEAQKNLEAVKLAYQETSANVRFRLRFVYVELLRLQKLLEVNKKIADRRKQNAELIELRYEAGREHQGSLMKADAIVEQALFEVRQTERRIESQSLRLGRELGGDFAYAFRIDGDLEKMIPVVMNERPDYAAISLETPQVRRFLKIAEAAKANVIAAQAAVWPQIDGSYNYGYSGPRASDLKRESFLGLTAILPFFNGGKNVAGILKARADYHSAREAARSTRDETVTQLSETWSTVADAAESVKVQHSFLEATRKRSEVVRSLYSSGLSNFQEFDIAEQDLSDSEKAYVQSLANALLRQADWDLLKGATLEEVIRES